MSAHSEFPASGARRLIQCPGSFRLTRELSGRGVQLARTSVYAAQGTAAHRLAEELLAHRGDKKAQAELLVDMDQPIEVEGHIIIPDQDFLDHVQTYTDYIETLEAFDYELKFEQRVSPTLPWVLRLAKPPVELFGTADCFGVHRQAGDIVVVDLKFGAGVTVNVTENPQLLYYALGVITPIVMAQTIKDSTPVELVVIQPRVVGGHEPKVFNTCIGDVIAWGNDVLKPAVERVFKPNARLEPGDWCQFCPAIAHCPELQRRAKEKARALFDDGSFEHDPSGALTVLSERSLGDDLLLAASLEPWIEALKEEATRRLSKGVPVPWHKLVQKRAIRKWTDEDAAVAIAASHGYDITKVEALSPAQAEKKAPRVDFKPFYEKVSSGVTVAHDSDPRPAVSLLTAKAVFDDDVLDNERQKRIARQ